MNRIKEMREARGLKQQDVADAMGLHLTNYNRLENGQTELTLSKMKAIAAILRCQPAELISRQTASRSVPVDIVLEADLWSDSSQKTGHERYELLVPDRPEWLGLTLHGGEVRGSSMNRRYPDGSQLVYTSMAETGEPPKAGRRYIVTRRRPDGLSETTVKTLWQDGDSALWLIAETEDPRHQAPQRLESSDTYHIEIVGHVVLAIIPEP